MSQLPVVPESLFDIVTVEDPQFSPDGRTIAFVRMQPVYHTNNYRRSIYLAPADGSAAPRPFTQGRQDFAPRWSPDGKQLAFLSTRDGAAQIYRMPVSGGEPVQLTNAPGGVSHPAWSPDGKWIAFNASTSLNEHDLEDKGLYYDPILQEAAAAWSKEDREARRDPRVIDKLPYRTGTSYFDGLYSHVYVIPATGGAPRRLSNGNFHHAAPSWTPDSLMVVTNSNRTQSSGDEFFELWSTVLGFDLDTGCEKILAVEVSEEGRQALVSPDGRRVAHSFLPKVPNPYAEPYFAAVTDMETGKTSILPATEDLTVADFQWSADSQSLTCIIHDHGRAKVMRLFVENRPPETLVDEDGMVQAFCAAPGGQKLAYTLSTPAHPSDLFVRDLSSGQVKRLTAFNDAWETTHAISLPTEVRYKGAGDVEIQGWFFRPKDFDPGKTYPLAVEIHGGPQVMWGSAFWHEFQVLCSRGYYVFFCNPRGSAGYGANFQRIREKGGYTDMADIMTGLDTVLALEKNADPERLAVTGGSYGGFLTGWIVGHTTRFKAAASQRGVYDQMNMFGSGDIPESVEWDHNGIPRKQTLEELWEYSPAAYASQVTTPLKILHSELDYRVPISQGETFFAHLRRAGNRDAVLVRFPREGHELSRSGEPRHRVRRLYEIVAWFDQHIQPERLRPRPLAQAEIEEALHGLPGWQQAEDALCFSLECGNSAIALNMANRAGTLARDMGYSISLDIRDSELLLRLGDNATGCITSADVHAARLLQARL